MNRQNHQNDISKLCSTVEWIVNLHLIISPFRVSNLGLWMTPVQDLSSESAYLVTIMLGEMELVSPTKHAGFHDPLERLDTETQVSTSNACASNASRCTTPNLGNSPGTRSPKHLSQNATTYFLTGLAQTNKSFNHPPTRPIVTKLVLFHSYAFPPLVLEYESNPLLFWTLNGTSETNFTRSL